MTKTQLEKILDKNPNNKWLNKLFYSVRDCSENLDKALTEKELKRLTRFEN